MTVRIVLDGIDDQGRRSIKLRPDIELDSRRSMQGSPEGLPVQLPIKRSEVA